MQTTIIDFIRQDIHAGEATLQIDPQEDLLSASLLSSMDMIRLIEFLETTYGFKFPPQDLVIENFISVDAMVAYIEQNR